ncbi:MAG: 3-deoxy-manno-octulosonate cytidylyltransferase [Chitinophagales bacterium]
MKNTIVGIIPARYASTRFPAKPLIDIGGKSMIQRVYEQAKKAKMLEAVYVATDDIRIKNHVEAFGGQVIMTLEEHQSGTDRCCEAAEKLSFCPNIIINIQGDEPFINPQQIDDLANVFQQKAATQIATLIKKITASKELFDENKPKVVINKRNEALYFSRQTIPFLREETKENWLSKQAFYKHIGIYAYRFDVLKQITKLPVSSLEKSEKLEQLRWLENGFAIQTAMTEYESMSIDTPQDLKKMLKAIDFYEEKK